MAESVSSRTSYGRTSSGASTATSYGGAKLPSRLATTTILTQQQGQQPPSQRQHDHEGSYSGSDYSYSYSYSSSYTASSTEPSRMPNGVPVAAWTTEARNGDAASCSSSCSCCDSDYETECSCSCADCQESFHRYQQNGDEPLSSCSCSTSTIPQDQPGPGAKLALLSEVVTESVGGIRLLSLPVPQTLSLAADADDGATILQPKPSAGPPSAETTSPQRVEDGAMPSEAESKGGVVPAPDPDTGNEVPNAVKPEAPEIVHDGKGNAPTESQPVAAEEGALSPSGGVPSPSMEEPAAQPVPTTTNGTNNSNVHRAEQAVQTDVQQNPGAGAEGGATGPTSHAKSDSETTAQETEVAHSPPAEPSPLLVQRPFPTAPVAVEVQTDPMPNSVEQREVPSPPAEDSLTPALRLSTVLQQVEEMESASRARLLHLWLSFFEGDLVETSRVRSSDVGNLRSEVCQEDPLPATVRDGGEEGATLRTVGLKHLLTETGRTIQQKEAFESEATFRQLEMENKWRQAQLTVAEQQLRMHFADAQVSIISDEKDRRFALYQDMLEHHSELRLTHAIEKRAIEAAEERKEVKEMRSQVFESGERLRVQEEDAIRVVAELKAKLAKALSIQSVLSPAKDSVNGGATRAGSGSTSRLSLTDYNEPVHLRFARAHQQAKEVVLSTSSK